MDPREIIQEIKQRAEAARAAGERGRLVHIHLDMFNAFASGVTESLAERDYQTAEELLEDWETVLEEAKEELGEKQIVYAHCRRQASSGYLWESRGLEEYFLYGDYVDAPRLMEKAELCHERSADLAARVPLGEDAPPEARQMQRNIEALQRAEQKRVHGMRMLMQGDYESEIGARDRATKLLQEAVHTLCEAEEEAPDMPDAGALAQVMERGQRELNFIDFARALLHKARADRAVLAGNFAEAARQEGLRAETLERCRTMHLRAGGSLHEGFARRLTRDVHVANQRHDRLANAARRRPRREGIKAAGFFVLAIGAAALFLWMIGRFDLQETPSILALLLLFAMAVAGVGAGLIRWKEAANWLRPGRKG